MSDGRKSHFDVAVIGAGIAGMATATRLAAAGLSVVVLEKHSRLGGCAGSFRRNGFSFDCGATTLVDFEPGGVGAEWLAAIGLHDLPLETVPAYDAWLPDRRIRLWRDDAKWRRERAAIGDTGSHRRFFAALDSISAAFWRATRRGARLPIGSLFDGLKAIRALGLVRLPMIRHLWRTLMDLLADHSLEDDTPLRGLLGMLVEDTVHARIETAPLVNAALGVTLRHAGLSRSLGGMGGFWRRVASHFRRQGGDLRLATDVLRFDRAAGRDAFLVTTSKATLCARRVVVAIPLELAARIGPYELGSALIPYLRRDTAARGGAIAVYLGVDDRELSGGDYGEIDHHQILVDYDAPFGDGNNMFVSASRRGDIESAPAGHRAVVLSTHCELAPWKDVADADYAAKKRAAGDALLSIARRVWPRLGDAPLVHEVATPKTYERFTGRIDGAVGGTRASLANANQRAVPHDLGIRGVRLVGDGTWPGLGTVACIAASRFVAADMIEEVARHGVRHRRPYETSLRFVPATRGTALAPAPPWP